MFPKPRAGNPLELALSDAKQRDPVRRANGVANLGVFGDDSTVKTVKGYAQDESEAVRVAAQYALLLLGQSEAIPKLIEFLGHEHHEYRKRAAVALTNATGSGITIDHENAEACKKSAKDYEAWFKKEGKGLVWDKKGRTFGAAGKKK